MSYAQLGQGDPLRSGPEREKMTQMDIAKLPKPGDDIIYAVRQIPTTAPEPDTSISGVGAGEKAIGDYNPKHPEFQAAYDPIKKSAKINDQQKRSALNILDYVDANWDKALTDPVLMKALKSKLDVATSYLGTLENIKEDAKITFGKIFDPAKFIAKTTQVAKAVIYTPAQIAQAEKNINDFCSVWANTLIQKQYCDRQLRNFRTLALSQGKQVTDPDVKIILDGYSSASKKLMDQLYAMEPTIKGFASKDNSFYDALNTAVRLAQTEGKGSLTSASGTRVTATLISGDKIPADQVGVPVGVIMVGIIVVGLVFTMSKALAAGAEVITRQNNYKINSKTIAGIDESAERQRKAWEDFKAGKITAVERDAIIKQEEQVQKNLKEVQDKGVDNKKSMDIPWAPFAVGAGVFLIGWIAYKKGWIQQSMSALQGGGLAGNLMKGITGPK